MTRLASTTAPAPIDNPTFTGRNDTTAEPTMAPESSTIAIMIPGAGPIFETMKIRIQARSAPAAPMIDAMTHPITPNGGRGGMLADRRSLRAGPRDRQGRGCRQLVLGL